MNLVPKYDHVTCAEEQQLTPGCVSHLTIMLCARFQKSKDRAEQILTLRYRHLFEDIEDLSMINGRGLFNEIHHTRYPVWHLPGILCEDQERTEATLRVRHPLYLDPAIEMLKYYHYYYYQSILQLIQNPWCTLINLIRVWTKGTMASAGTRRTWQQHKCTKTAFHEQ